MRTISCPCPCGTGETQGFNCTDFCGASIPGSLTATVAQVYCNNPPSVTALPLQYPTSFTIPMSIVGTNISFSYGLGSCSGVTGNLWCGTVFETQGSHSGWFTVVMACANTVISNAGAIVFIPCQSSLPTGVCTASYAGYILCAAALSTSSNSLQVFSTWPPMSCEPFLWETQWQGPTMPFNAPNSNFGFGNQFEACPCGCAKGLSSTCATQFSMSITE